MSPAQSWSDLYKDAGEAAKPLEALPNNTYNFKVESAEAGQTKTDKKKFTIKASVEDGPHENRKVWHDFIISPESANALAFFFRNMSVLGLDEAFFATNPSDTQITQALTGKRFRGKTEQREWNGKKKAEIREFSTPLAAGGIAGIPSPGVPAPAPAAVPAPVPAPVVAAPAPAPQVQEASQPVAPAPAPQPVVAAPAVPNVPAPTVDPWENAQAAPAPGPAFAPAPPAQPSPESAPAAPAQNAPAPPPF